MSTISPLAKPPDEVDDFMEFDSVATQAITLVCHPTNLKDLPISPPDDELPPSTSALVKGKSVQTSTSHESTSPKPQILGLPLELLLHIYSQLNPIDAVCLSLISKHMYNIAQQSDIRASTHSRLILHVPLTIGAPDSEHPVVKSQGCRHCRPVLFQPAHCELNFHLRSFMPKHMRSNLLRIITQLVLIVERASGDDLSKEEDTCQFSPPLSEDRLSPDDKILTGRQ
ncbi:hypothetical protein BJ878DRAFT_475929 [Calycina marina]|uniref:F-box domain-containing protein n=1 Tax=Calycina marina TaxID=1763456 RepID=A0A9P7ZBV9_9HELO|nr:hypothetical protein BJ878DRAFT_475929 [Calycina marina]